MSHVIKVPLDIWEWGLRNMGPQDEFELWMNAELYPCDVETRLMTVPDFVWEKAQRQSQHPEELLIAVLRQHMEENP